MTHRVFQPPQQRHRSDSRTTSAGRTSEPRAELSRGLAAVGRGGGWGLAFLHGEQVREANANGFHEP